MRWKMKKKTLKNQTIVVFFNLILDFPINTMYIICVDRKPNSKNQSKGLTVTREQVISLASDLVDDGENVEYTRGVAEMIAYMFPVEGEMPSDRVDEITNEIVRG